MAKVVLSSTRTPSSPASSTVFFWIRTLAAGSTSDVSPRTIPDAVGDRIEFFRTVTPVDSTMTPSAASSITHFSTT